MNLLRLKVVLATIDIDDPALESLRTADALAAAAGAKLEIVYVQPPSASAASAPGREISARNILDRAHLKTRPSPLHMLAGEPAKAIRALADQVRADVIVLGPHRERHGDRVLGSTALAVVTSAWAPCLISARAMRLPLERVLVPIDGSQTARGALMVALSWASALRRTDKRDSASGASASLTALFVEASSGSRGRERPVQPLGENLDRLRRDAGSWAGVSIDGPVVQRGDVAEQIAAFAADTKFDLVVLGTRGVGLDAAGRLGSVSAAVTKRLETPILLVPPAVWRRYERDASAADAEAAPASPNR